MTNIAHVIARLYLDTDPGYRGKVPPHVRAESDRVGAMIRDLPKTSDPAEFALLVLHGIVASASKHEDFGLTYEQAVILTAGFYLRMLSAVVLGEPE